MPVATLEARVENGAQRRILIDYIDANGDPSHRQIQPLSLFGEMDGDNFRVRYISAYCMKARANRSFKSERIQSLFDPNTGEEMELESWLSSLKVAKPVDMTSFAEEVQLARTSSSLSLRWIALALLGGYLVGRIRLLKWLFVLIGWKWGYWL